MPEITRRSFLKIGAATVGSSVALNPKQGQTSTVDQDQGTYMDTEIDSCCKFCQVSEFDVFETVLIRNDALSPAVRIAQLIDIRITVKPAPVMEIQDQIHLIVQDQGFYLFNGFKFRVTCLNIGKLPVQVAVNTPGSFYDAEEIQVGNDPDIPGFYRVMCCDNRSGIKATRLVPLDSPDNQDRIAWNPGLKFMD